MVVSVSFEKRVPPGSAKRGTLAELMAKQRAQADIRNQAMQEETPTIMQGLGKMANVLGAAWGERRAEREEMAGRDELARIKAQVGLGEATPEQLAQIGGYDPDLENTMRQEALAARQREQDRQNKLADLQESRQYETTQEGAINERERLEAEAVTKAQREEAERVRLAGVTGEETINERERLEAEAIEKRKVAEAERVRLAGVEAGKETILSGDAAVAEGAQPGQQVIKSGGGQLEIKDAPASPKMSRPPTEQEITSYNLAPAMAKGASTRMVSEDGGVNWKPEQIGSAPQDSALAGEVAGRVGLMDDFLKIYPDLLKKVEGGVLSGAGFAKSAVGMPGESSNALREIQTGSEALVRMLTGAGMLESEAKKYSGRYEPSLWSLLGPEESATKVRELYEDLWNVREAVTQNHRFNDNPAVFRLRKDEAPVDPNAPAATPEGDVPTEEDITFMMEKYGKTRVEILRLLDEKKAKAGGQQ